MWNGSLVVDGVAHSFDAVVCTVPTPYVTRIVPGLSAQAKAKYEAIGNIGCVCVALKLAKPITRHFWVNVNDPTIDIPGMVEFSNLRRLPDTVVYIPYYMPQTNPKFGRSSEEFVAEAFGYLRRINPALQPGDLKASHVGRLRHAQPVCEPGFLAKIPKVQTEIAGLQILHQGRGPIELQPELAERGRVGTEAAHQHVLAQHGAFQSDAAPTQLLRAAELSPADDSIGPAGFIEHQNQQRTALRGLLADRDRLGHGGGQGRNITALEGLALIHERGVLQHLQLQAIGTAQLLLLGQIEVLVAGPGGDRHSQLGPLATEKPEQPGGSGHQSDHRSEQQPGAQAGGRCRGGWRVKAAHAGLSAGRR